MNLVDRINAAVLRRIRSRAITASETLETGGTELTESIERIKRLAAVLSDNFAGETMMLVASLDDGRVVRIDEDDPQWTAVLSALDGSGRTGMTSTEWRLHLMGDENRAPIVLIG